MHHQLGQTLATLRLLLFRSRQLTLLVPSDVCFGSEGGAPRTIARGRSAASENEASHVGR
jgi:hypothetical protein